MDERKAFEHWAQQAGIWGKNGTESAWEAWQAATKAAEERHRLEMAGVVQVIATAANNLQNFAGNLEMANR